MKRRLSFAMLIFLFVLIGAELALRGMGAAYLEIVRTPPERFRPDANVKILCLGDSFTFGTGAEADASYPAQLQRRLDEHFGAGTAQVVNWGRPARNTSEALLALDDALAAGIRPDYLVVALGINNYWNWHLGNAFVPGGDPLKKVHATASGLRVWRLLTVALTGGPRAVRKLYGRNDTDDGQRQYFIDRLEQDRDWIGGWITSDLDAIYQLCNRHGVQMIFVRYHSDSHNITYAHEQFLAAHPVPTADCRWLGTRDREEFDKLLSGDGWHPNAQGYARVAATVENALLPLIDATPAGGDE